MSILGTCPECLHHTDGMCDLRPRICLNYDHFERLPTVTLSRDVFETQYISRATFDAEVARLTAKLQSAKSEVDEILRAALSGDCDRYLNYDLQGNKYCKWGVASMDIAAVFDVTEPSDIDVSEQGFND